MGQFMNSLIPFLKALRNITSKDKEDSFKLSIKIHEVENNPEKADPKLVSIFKEVKKIPELSIFDNLMQVIGNSAIRLSYGFLIHWLIEKTFSESAEAAIQDLKKYLSIDKIPFLEVSAISGIKIDNPCVLEKNIQLIPWDSFPDSVQKEYIHKEFAFRTPFHSPGAALVKEKLLKRIHVSQDETNDYIESDLFSELNDALLCINLVGPISAYSIAKWLHPPKWAIVQGSGYHLPFLEGRASHRDWPLHGCNQAQELHAAFIALSEKSKSSIRLPLERLNMAMRRISNVDAAIDLGIALESIFLNELGEDRGELTFRLKLRASRFLGSNLNERKKLFRIFGKLYELRSKAVHSGKLPDNLGKTPIKDILEEGFNLTAKAISKIILYGFPNWQDLSLM